MKLLKKLGLVVPAILIVWGNGCSDTVEPPPPPAPPPSIQIEAFNASTTNLARKLPHDEVHDILVDSQNRTWFATDQGVALSEQPQANMKVFDQFDGIPNRNCRALAELNGKIFVGTWGNGIGVYDGTPIWGQLTVADGLVAGKINSLAADDTSLWIATVQGVSQYIDRDDLEMSERWIDHTNRLGDNLVVNKVLVHDDGLRGPEVWLGTQADGLTIVRLPAMHSVFGFSNPLSVYAVGDGGAIMNFDGSRWQSMSSGTQSDLRAVWGFDEENLYAVGEGGEGRFFNGERWQSTNTRTLNTLNGIWGNSDENIYAVGDKGTIVRFNGDNWSVLSSGTTIDLYGVWGSSADDVYATGENGIILKYNGDSWRPVDIAGNPTDNLHAIWGSSASSVFAVGDNGRVIVSANAKPIGSGRPQWTPIANPLPQNLKSVWGNSASDVYAAGSSGGLFHFDGIAWSPVPSVASPNLTFNSIWSASQTDVFAVGALSTYVDGPERFYRYDGGAWEAMPGTEQFLKSVAYTESNTDIPGSEVSDISPDPTADIFWLSFATRGIGSVDIAGSVWKNYGRVDGLNSDVVHSVGIDQAGTVWAGTQTGLTERPVNGETVNYIAASGLPDARVRKVYVDRNNVVWLAFIEAGAGYVKQ